MSSERQTPRDGTAPSHPESDAVWRGILLGTDRRYRQNVALMRRIPGSPRCYLCQAPFGGLGAPIARLFGKWPWPKNPHYCSRCFDLMEAQRGGAEVPCSLLFADVRGSTGIAERMRPGEFHALMDRFYAVAAEVLFAHDAILDKFVGDEAVAIFIPALSGELHAARAVAAGRALLAATGHGADSEPWLPIGIGVHTGVAYVGAVGESPSTTVTALGDAVNIAARLAETAAGGELLVSQAAAGGAGLGTDGLERRELALKGRSERVSVVVLRGPVATAA